MSAVAALMGEYVTNMTNYLIAGQNDSNRTEEQVATKFTEEYLSAMSKGFNPIINNKLHASMLNINGPKAKLYKKTLLDAMLLAKQDKSPGGAAAKTLLQTAFMAAATTYWTGALLEGVFKGMPPGHVNILSIVPVVFPGVVPPIILPPNSPSNPPMLPLIVATAYAAQLPQIMFLCTAFLPPPAPPYPLPLLTFV